LTHIASFEDDEDKFNWESTAEKDAAAFLGIQVDQSKKNS